MFCQFERSREHRNNTIRTLLDCARSDKALCSVTSDTAKFTELLSELENGSSVLRLYSKDIVRKEVMLRNYLAFRIHV